MECKKKTTKKYTSRKSPPYNANECCDSNKQGNDGRMYVSIPNKNGVCRWVLKKDSPVKTLKKKKSPIKTKSTSKKKSPSKLNVKKKMSTSTKKTKIYHTHDNGGRPFQVIYDGNKNVKIYKEDQSYWEDIFQKPKKIGKIGTHDIYQAPEIEDFESEYNELVKEYNNVQKVFVGKSKLEKDDKHYESEFNGNSILLKLPQNRYVFIGTNIYEFTSPEAITKYYSTVGNNDVPYPTASSKNYMFFMLKPLRRHDDPKPFTHIHYADLSEIPDDEKEDAYGYYYDELGGYKGSQDKLKQLPIKLIQERLY